MDRRRSAEQHRHGSRRQRPLWKAWWLYPVLLLLGVCIYLGIRSASTPVPEGPQWIVTSNSPEPVPAQSSSG